MTQVAKAQVDVAPPRPLLCILHPNGLHRQCTAEDLRNWIKDFGDPTLGGLISARAVIASVDKARRRP